MSGETVTRDTTVDNWTIIESLKAEAESAMTSPTAGSALGVTIDASVLRGKPAHAIEFILQRLRGWKFRARGTVYALKFDNAGYRFNIVSV